MTQKSLSIDYHLELSVNKFPDAALIFRKKLTSQILTNQSIKIERS